MSKVKNPLVGDFGLNAKIEAWINARLSNVQTAAFAVANLMTQRLALVAASLPECVVVGGWRGDDCDDGYSFTVRSPSGVKVQFFAEVTTTGLRVVGATSHIPA